MAYNHHARYNGKVGIYNQGIEQYINQDYWDIAWGPTPSYWYDAASGNILEDRVSTNDFPVVGSNFSYDEKLNNLSVAKADTYSYGSIALSSVAPVYTAMIFIVSEIPYTYINTSNDSIAVTYDHYYSGQEFDTYNRLRATSTGITEFSARTVAETGKFPAGGKYVSTTQSTSSTDTWAITISKHSASTNSLEVNGDVYLASNTGEVASGTSNTLTYGISAGLKIAEILVYDVILSDEDITSIEDHLKTKWGLTY